VYQHVDSIHDRHHIVPVAQQPHVVPERSGVTLDARPRRSFADDQQAQGRKPRRQLRNG